MKPIWYFVGLLMVVIGGLVLFSGVWNYFNPGNNKTGLADLHPNLWWGGIMVIAGAVFLLANRKKKLTDDG